MARLNVRNQNQKVTRKIIVHVFSNSVSILDPEEGLCCMDFVRSFVCFRINNSGNMHNVPNLARWPGLGF
jgi:hypothetical protein